MWKIFWLRWFSSLFMRPSNNCCCTYDELTKILTSREPIVCSNDKLFYLWPMSIEADKYGLRVLFQIHTTPPPEGWEQSTVKCTSKKRIEVRLGEQNIAQPIFGYTLFSKLTYKQNLENIKEFVLENINIEPFSLKIDK